MSTDSQAHWPHGVCRVAGCNRFVLEGTPGEKDQVCLRCYEELTALDEMREARRRKKRSKDDDGPGPMDGLPAFAV